MGYLADVARYRHAYAIAASAAMGSIFYGWDIGLIGGVLALPSFKSYFGIDKLSKSASADLSGNIVAVLQGGCLYVPDFRQTRVDQCLLTLVGPVLVPWPRATSPIRLDASQSYWPPASST